MRDAIKVSSCLIFGKLFMNGIYMQSFQNTRPEDAAIFGEKAFRQAFLSQKGFSVPQDIAIMTFDNYPFSMLTQPQLTAVEADMFDMGQKAARFILHKIRMPELQTQSYCTIPRVIERKST